MKKIFEEKIFRKKMKLYNNFNYIYLHHNNEEGIAITFGKIKMWKIFFAKQNKWRIVIKLSEVNYNTYVFKKTF